MTQDLFDASQARPTSRIGAYEVLGHWASGAVSHIYVARKTGDSDASRLYALKVPRTAHAIYAANEGIFLRGAERGPEVRDPYTISTRDVLDRNGRLYMVTDFVHGELLSQVLSARPGVRWPVSLALQVGLHIARALVFVHGCQEGDVRPHGEVGPVNISLGYDGRARLLDSAIIGTQRRLDLNRHLAPEQAAELPDVDPRVDVYGVGLVIWEMLVGRPALVGRNETEIRAAALEGRIDPPSAHGSPTDASVDEVVMRALSVEREQRFCSATKLAEALEAELSRLSPDRDLDADLREALRRIFPRGASRLSRELSRWSQPPDRAMLMRADGPMAAINAALQSRRTSEEPSFVDFDAALEDLARALPPVTDTSPSMPAAVVPAPAPKPSRRPLLLALIAAVAGLALAAFFVTPSPPAPHGSLRIVTEPPGATVQVDRRPVGRTPLLVGDLKVGVHHSITIRREGFAPVEREVRFDKGGERGWDLELKPIEAPAEGADDAFKDNPY